MDLVSFACWALGDADDCDNSDGAIQEAFAALKRQGRPYEEYRYFTTRWGEVDAKGAMEYFKTNNDPKVSAWDATQIMKGWGQSAPQDALKWIAENPDILSEYSKQRRRRRRLAGR